MNRDVHGSSNFGTDARGERAYRNESLKDESKRQPPHDPTPQWVYWVRRIVALILVVAVLSLVGWALSGIVAAVTGDDTAKTSSEQTADQPKATDVQKAGASSDSDQESSKKPSGNSPKACDPASVNLNIAVVKDTVSSGSSIPFVLEVANEAGAACILDISSTSTVLTVSSGQDRIWSNDDCDDSGTKAMYMEDSARTATDIVWNGARSNPECEANLPSVKPGTYRAVANYGETLSNELVFHVK